MKFGPSLGIVDASGSQFRLEFHFGINLTPQLPHHIYLDFPLGFGFGNGFTDILIVPGVEADIALPVGVPLYIYPMFGLGVGFFFPSCPANFQCSTTTALGIRLGAGVKYVLQGRYNFFFEPLNLEFYPAGFEGATPGFYNLLFGGGFNF
jgi:hypothetical protein